MSLLAIEKHIPWVVFEAKIWLDSYLTKDMSVFEYGSGGSTLYFAEKARFVSSVEHNPVWYNEVKTAISHFKIKNCDYHLEEPRRSNLLMKLPYSTFFYNSKTFSEYADCSFKKYVKRINTYKKDFFDIIFIDGRARVSCLRFAVKRIKKGGVIILDNSERELYQKEMNKLCKLERKDFFGNGPYLEEKWQTTLWIAK